MKSQYENPPVRQVVCEFRFVEGSPWDMSIPGLIYSKMVDEFPRRLVIKPPEIGTTVIGGSARAVPPQLQQFALGLVQNSLRFWRQEDESGFISVSTNTVSVTHNKPYPSWVGLRPIILKTFNAYKDSALPSGLQRIGLRYINEFQFELGNLELEEYFNFFPYQGPHVPQNISSFNCSIESPFNSNRDVLRFTLATRPSQQQDGLTLSLDLDFFLQNPSSVDLENIPDWLDNAHMNIESAFEGCIKDSLRARFKQKA